MKGRIRLESYHASLASSLLENSDRKAVSRKQTQSHWFSLTRVLYSHTTFTSAKQLTRKSRTFALILEGVGFRLEPEASDYSNQTSTPYIHGVAFEYAKSPLVQFDRSKRERVKNEKRA
ncbi:hypothetical protein KQX54_010144 [Cotesia glomerata]|uniref:Uncharacterized protein n=1 Tax=Cotesia glomerata TaxID=32391 RepID=A0AAV7J6P4_COTGL|nr:hypothetical protein KQX54_010144 [Cotesia glomerata]